jgi:6,7-dimethyl-8-ribityllumazine synthase
VRIAGMENRTAHVFGKGLKVGVVASRFNEKIVAGLLKGALAALAKAGVKDDAVTVVRVPGAWEIPFAVRTILKNPKKPALDCVIALGAVIRGETAHFEYVSNGAITGCSDAQRDFGVPVALGILTTENEAQAVARSTGGGNVGIEAAHAALEMANLAKAFR